MTNDTSTLNGALQELGETMASNLTSQGVTASASDGLTTLSSKILNISGGGGTINLSSNKSSISLFDSETATITATYTEGAGATLKLYINDTFITNMTDSGSGTYIYNYTAVGNGYLEIYVKAGNTISNTIYINDYLKIGFDTNDTWHQINNSNTMTVTDGVATGYNKLMDYSWDNTKDWEFTCKYKANSASANGLLFADVTNTSNFDYNSFTVLQTVNESILRIAGHTGSAIWAGVVTSVGSRDYVDVKVKNVDGVLTFYLNGTKQYAYPNVTGITDICVGMYSWEGGTGSFKDITVKYLSFNTCPALEEEIDDAILYINGTGS